MNNYLYDAMTLMKKVSKEDDYFDPKDYEFRVTPDVYKKLKDELFSCGIKYDSFLFGIKIVTDYLINREESYIRIVKKPKRVNYSLSIDNVIFNDPATIVFWKDGSKTVVKCSEDDMFDEEKGLAMAIVKKMFGNDNSYHKIFKKWCPEDETYLDLDFAMTLQRIGESLNKAFAASLDTTNSKE